MITIKFNNILFLFLAISSLIRIQSCKDDKITETENPIIIDKPINFQATVKGGTVELSWENPTSLDIIGTLVIRNETRQPESHSDGVEIFRGQSDDFEDCLLANGIRYYYAIYTFDNRENYSDADFAEAISIENSVPENPFVIYMAPNGSDSNDGLTSCSPLLSLSKVQERLIELKPVIDCDIEVRIKLINNVSFVGQTISWGHTSPNNTISFMPLDYNYGDGINDISGRPIFDGNGIVNSFFILDSRGGKTNVRFYYIRIQEYIKQGILFSGDGNDLEKWNGYNTVYGCYFYEIGNKKYPNAQYGYGAIVFSNSDYNSIRNNHFVKAENRSEKASKMHGVYLADNSDNNKIISNRFYKISGDPVRVRDFSNYNLIFDNLIEKSGKYAYFSTYRNAETGECRSWENEFRDNTVNCGYSGEKIKLFRYFVRWNGDGNLDDGPQYPVGDCQIFCNWLYTSGNDRPCL